MAFPNESMMLFLGHFHPLLVHLPIGGLVILGFLEILAGLILSLCGSASAEHDIDTGEAGESMSCTTSPSPQVGYKPLPARTSPWSAFTLDGGVPLPREGEK